MQSKLTLLYNKIKNKHQRTFMIATISLIINFAYGIGNAVIGFMSFSWWFLTVSVYHIILSIMRFCLVISHQKGNAVSLENSNFLKRFSGGMLLCLSVVLAGTVLLTISQDIGTKYHEIVMITVATYTFTKLVFAILNFCKSKTSGSPIITTLQSISAADAAASIFSLQRSMLLSFDGMRVDDIRLFNTLTGFGVCIVVFIIGVNLLRKEKKNG